MKGRNSSRRKWNESKTLYGIFLFFLLVLFVSYAYVALSPSVLGINIQEFAKTRNTYSSTLKAKRGTIYDKDGNVLALNVYSYTVIAYLDSSRTSDPKQPHHVVDVEGTAKSLSPILDMKVETLVDLMSQKDLYQVELGPGGRNISELKKEAIEELELPGIDFIESTKRFYPNGDFASYVVGYAKTNEHTLEDGSIVKVIDGELGVEGKYDDELKGTDGYLSYQQDAHGYKIPETKEERKEALDGDDIYLTIDASVQRFVEEAMDEAEKNYNYEWLQFHVMDAKTGDILASASSPSFDPNIREIVNYENNLTSIEFEPGSVMKAFTYMCAMEKGTYDGSKTFRSGSIDVEGTKIYDWNRYGWGDITYDYGFVQSSNVAITNMLLNDEFINKTDLKNCLTKYGFGEKTNIELPREASGLLDFNYPIEVAAAGYGQGIYVTPIQILQGYSILSNNGSMVTPHIVKKIVDSNTGEIKYERKLEVTKDIVKQSTVNKMYKLMDAVVNSEDGSGSIYSLQDKGIGIMGKTGTGQIYENGGYLAYQYIRSFVGMFPKENPKVVIFASVKKSDPDSSGSISYGVKSIAQNIAKYYNLYSEIKDNSISEYKVGNYISRDIVSVNKELIGLKLNPYFIGDGTYIINQYPKVGSSILAGEKVFLLTNGNKYIMPDMTGWSRSDVVSYFSLINVKYKIEGNGYVTLQSILANKEIDRSSEVVITLSSKY